MKKSPKTSAISTYRKSYAVKTLFFKGFPKELHRIIDQIIQDLDGVAAYFDVTVVQLSTINEFCSMNYQHILSFYKYTYICNIQLFNSVHGSFFINN